MPNKEAIQLQIQRCYPQIDEHGNKIYVNMCMWKFFIDIWCKAWPSLSFTVVYFGYARLCSEYIIMSIEFSINALLFLWIPPCRTNTNALQYSVSHIIQTPGDRPSKFALYWKRVLIQVIKNRGHFYNKPNWSTDLFLSNYLWNCLSHHGISML